MEKKKSVANLLDPPMVLCNFTYGKNIHLALSIARNGPIEPRKTYASSAYALIVQLQWNLSQISKTKYMLLKEEKDKKEFWKKKKAKMNAYHESE